MAILRNIVGCLCWLPLLLGGCEACVGTFKKSQNLQERALMTNSENRFAVDSESLLAKAPNFSYKSELTVSIGQGDRKDDNREIILITAKAPRIVLHKKIDDLHFFEIFKDGDQFFVKNLNGPWRSGFDNSPMYSSLFQESFNLTAWLIDQFALNDRFALSGKKMLVIKDAEISQDAPFLVNLAQQHPQFARLEKSLVNATVSIDETTKLPLSATFNITLAGKEQYWLSVQASVMMDIGAVAHDLLVPQIVDAVPVETPVNIAPRFNELMKSEKGENRK